MDIITLPGILTVYSSNSDAINSYLSGSSNYNFNDFFGIGITAFIILVLLAITLWLCAVVLLVKSWDRIPTWVKVLGTLGVLPVPIPGLPIAYNYSCIGY